MLPRRYLLLLLFPLILISFGTLGYLASLPFGWLSYREQERKAEDAATASPPSLQAAADSESLLSSPQGRMSDDQDEDRPTRLN